MENRYLIIKTVLYQICVAIGVFISVVIATIVSMLIKDELLSVIAYNLLYILGMCCLIYFVIKTEKIKFEIKKQAFQKISLFNIILITVFAIAVSVVSSDTVRYIGVNVFNSYDNSLVETSKSLLIIIIDFFMSIFIAPILEEMTMRFCYISATRKYSCIPISLIMSSLLFGIFHNTSLCRVVDCFIVGLFLGTIFILTNNILYCIIAHSSMNLFILIITIIDETSAFMSNKTTDLLSNKNGYALYNKYIYITCTIIIVSFSFAILLRRLKRQSDFLKNRVS